MKKILKARWAIFALWLVVTIALTVTQPDINAILRNRGQQSLSENSPSVLADNILKKMETTKGSNDIIVFYKSDKLSETDLSKIGDAVKSMSDNKAELGINDMIDPFNMPEAKDSLISEDKTTLMVSFKLDKGTREVDTIKKQFDNKLSNVGVEYYLSGEDFINNDYLQASQAGVEKSAALTVIFILVVLIIMFRSVIAPVISLLAVVFSYLCSMGIAAQLIDKANFPITSLTQMLLILILFGIGTDYNILLFNRFKEELSHGLSIDDAIVSTYKTAGKTIAFSILTVFIAFFSLIFAESPIYKSGVVVVIGVAMLLLEILTLTPFIMKLLGNKLFWPSKSINGHKESRLWGKTSSIATKHPIITVAIVLLIMAPMVYLNQEKLNFDTISELGDSYPSSKGFHIVSEHFGKGQAMPSTIVIENNNAMDNNDSLSVVDDLTEKVRNIKGVKKVSSITQPEGKEIEGFYISNQTKSVTDGLSKTQDGVDKIYKGMKTASDKLGSSDFSKVNQMVDGTSELQSAVTALAGGLEKVQNGLSSSEKNTQSISAGITTISENLTKVSGGVKTLSENYAKMQSGYSQLGANYQGAAQALLGVKSALEQMQPMVTAIGNNYSKSQSDKAYLGLKQTIDQLLTSLKDITPEGIKTLNDNYNNLTNGFGTANQSLSSISTGLSQMADGLNKINSGLGKASDGIGTIVTNMNKVSDGLGQMKTGQKKLVTGLNGFSTFGDKLTDVSTGLKKISDGIGQTNDFLLQLTSNKTFYIPNEAITNEDFKKAMDMYMSEDRKVTKLNVILDNDPYSKEALNTVDKINKTVAAGLKGTVLSSANYGVSGPSATTSDMNKILTNDLNRLMVIVLVGVFIVLILVTRTIWAPVIITVSLMVAYYASSFILNFVFLDIKGLAGISSFVPFFSFIIIVALGVDYSIFMMMRFKEYPELAPKEAIVSASKHIGGVVMSAVIILGGTFATLMPSGIILLEEWATAVISGLIVLCFILLPVFLPAMITLPGTLTSKKEELSMKADFEK